MLRFVPILDYRQYRQIENEGGVFSFTGEIESISGQTLWVRGKDLTIPVSLKNTQSWLLPKFEREQTPDAPEKINWDRVSTLSEGIKVFIGGSIAMQNNRQSFISTKEKPLMVILYDCPDADLPSGIIRAARTRNEYWNYFTPVSLIIGALSLIIIAASFLNRPAFRLTAISALAAVFVPILPIIPPGLLFTILYRRMTWHSRNLRAYWDLARFGFLPDSSGNLAKRYAVKAYTLEAFAWFLMLTGIVINIIFIFMVLSLFQVITF